MRTVASLIAELQKFPPDALAIPDASYRIGHTEGIAICSAVDPAQPPLGFVPMSGDDYDVDGPAIMGTGE